MKYLVLIILLLPIKEMNCQITNTTNTMGILYSEPKKVSEGYLLFVPLESQNAYLIDNCGIVVNTWTFEHTLIHSGCYLLEDGSILKLSVSGFTYEFESYIERRSWDNELVWQYSLKSEKGKLHSDLHILPNGNILVLKEEKIEVKKAISLGVNPNLLDNKYNLETLIELKPIGVDSATIVWQWRLEDRLVQEYDDLKDNYGIVADFPRKYNANLYNGFTHFNSIDYNKDLDQIILSSWSDDEIYIIDHSTTTEEAASSAGGTYGYGGDFLFRWGKPSNYGSKSEQKLLAQHNPRWIPNNFKCFGGMISIFNNRHNELYAISERKSAVVIINPDPDGDGVYEFEEGNFLPVNYEFVLPNKGEIRGPMFSLFLSGAIVQPNCNILTCEGASGRLTEFDKDGRVVWMYQSPIVNELNVGEQGSTPQVEVYKVEKYAPLYAGLAGKNLCGKDVIENENTLSEQYIEFWRTKLSFSYTIEGKKVAFTLTSTNIGNLVWNFGDGNTAMEENPVHIFEMLGTYEVCLSGSNCYGNDSYCDNIEVSLTNTDPIQTSISILKSNIIKDKLFFNQNSILHAEIYNSTGSLVIRMKAPRHSIKVGNLQNGVYYLKIRGYKSSYWRIERFIKL